MRCWARCVRARRWFPIWKRRSLDLFCRAVHCRSRCFHRFGGRSFRPGLGRDHRRQHRRAFRTGGFQRGRAGDDSSRLVVEFEVCVAGRAAFERADGFRSGNADRWIFFVAPYIAVVAAFIVLAVVPFGPDWGVITDVNIGVLFVLAVSSVGVLATILAGWSSNSKYALLGALRSSAQMVSDLETPIAGSFLSRRTLP